MKHRYGWRLAPFVLLLCPSLGAGCFWRERPEREVHVERGHADHDDRGHERRAEPHEERHETDRH